MILTCLLYTSDAADERSSVDLGGRRIIKKKKKYSVDRATYTNQNKNTDWQIKIKHKTRVNMKNKKTKR